MVHCVVTGATGYVGGRLAPRLLDAGHTVRCLARNPNRLRDSVWAAQADIVQADLAHPHGLTKALTGADVAYYLVRSAGDQDFADIDRRAAYNFAAAARAAGVRRVVYLAPPPPVGQGEGSAHLRSRAEVANILLAGDVPTVVLRAAMILGSKSASFEMLRYLTERLPMMVTPRWVTHQIRPIDIRDVLRYLTAWATVPDKVNRAFDIGGPATLTYADMIRRYAQATGLPPRLIVPFRPLSPRLSAYWVGMVTPLPGRTARPLIDSLVHEFVHEPVHPGHDITRYVPAPLGGMVDFDEAVRLARVGTADDHSGDPHLD